MTESASSSIPSKDRSGQAREPYRVIEESLVLPPMTASQATAFLELDRREKATVWLRTVREWIRARS